MLTLYSTTSCAYCKMVAKYLESKNVAYEKIMLDDNQELRYELQKKTGATTVPITTNGIEYVIGWQPAKLAALISF